MPLVSSSWFPGIKAGAKDIAALIIFSSRENAVLILLFNASYQDVNDNGKCDRNLFGYPTERFGFSKNYRPKISAPSFDDIKIAVLESTKDSIALIGN